MRHHTRYNGFLENNLGKLIPECLYSGFYQS